MQSIQYCLIDGLAVNAYAEPVVSLDIDVVIATKDLPRLIAAIPTTFVVKQFPYSLNLEHPQSGIRIQVQLDERYASFTNDAQTKTVLGYELKVASVENVLQGKIWAYLDPERRKSKRQKDLADILRLIEVYPNLTAALPHEILKVI